MKNCKTWTDPHDPTKWQRYIEVNGRLVKITWKEYCDFIKTGKIPDRLKGE